MKVIFLLILAIVSESQNPQMVVHKGINEPLQQSLFRINNSLQTSTNDSGVFYNPDNSNYQIHLLSNDIVNNETIQFIDTSTYGMRADSPIPLLIQFNFTAVNTGCRSFSVQTNVFFQNQKEGINHITIYFASQNFGLSSPVNLIDIKQRTNYNFTRTGDNHVSLSITKATFIGTIDITDFLHYFTRQIDSLPRVYSNRIVSSISHTITIRINPCAASDSDRMYFYAKAKPNTYNSIYSNVSLPFSNLPTYQMFHDFPSNLLEMDYANLTRKNNEALSFSNTNFQNSITQPKSSNIIMLASPYTDDYIAIGYVREQWFNATQYDLPLAVNSSKSILSNFSFIITTYDNSFSAVCFTLLLRDDYYISNKSFSVINDSNQTKIIQICPYRNVSHKDGQLKQISTQFKLFTFNNNTFIFQSTPPVNQVTNLNLMKYVRSVSKYIFDLSNYWIVGIKTGFQVYEGKASFKYNSLSFEKINNNIEQFTFRTNFFFCPLGSSNDDSSSSCKMNPEINRIVSPILAMPNVGLLLKIGPFIGMVDDLSYFVYHDQNYDGVFKYFSEIAWNWTNSKWQPPFGLGVYLPFQISSTTKYSQKWIKDTQKTTPIRLKWINQDLFFLNNCRGYLLYTIPVSILSFYLIFIFRNSIEPYLPKLAGFLVTFSSWAYLIISLFGDNLQYVSFRSFEQFRYLNPSGTLSLISIILAVTINFLAIVCAVVTYFIALKWANSKFQPALLKKHHQSCYYLGTWMITRFFSGFAHAYIDNKIERLSFLLSLQILMVFTSAHSGLIARFKFSLTFMVYGQIVRLLLYLLALFEVAFPELINIISNHGCMMDSSYSLIICLYIANILQIGLHIFIGVLMKGQTIEKVIESVPQSSSGQQAKETQGKQKRSPVMTKRKTRRHIEIQANRDKNIEELYKKVGVVKSILQQPQLQSSFISKESDIVKNFDPNSVVAMLKHRQNRLKFLARSKYQNKAKRSQTEQNTKPINKTNKSIKSVKRVQKELQLLRKS